MGLDNPVHIAFLLIILLLVFGAKRLPEMGRSLGSGLRGFKETLSGDAPASPALTAATEPPATEHAGAPAAALQPVAAVVAEPTTPAAA